MNEVIKTSLEETRGWALEELEIARIRVMNLRTGGDAYNRALEAVDSIVWLLDRIGNLLDGTAYSITKVVSPTRTETVEYPGPDAVVTSLTMEFEEPPEDEPEPEPEKPPRVVDIAEVRTKAKAARDAGVKLANVWAEFDGGTKLSDVPPSRYAELLDLLEKKMQEAGA